MVQSDVTTVGHRPTQVRSAADQTKSGFTTVLDAICGQQKGGDSDTVSCDATVLVVDEPQPCPGGDVEMEDKPRDDDEPAAADMLADAPTGESDDLTVEVTDVPFPRLVPESGVLRSTIRNLEILSGGEVTPSATAADLQDYETIGGIAEPDIRPIVPEGDLKGNIVQRHGHDRLATLQVQDVHQEIGILPKVEFSLNITKKSEGSTGELDQVATIMSDLGPIGLVQRGPHAVPEAFSTPNVFQRPIISDPNSILRQISDAIPDGAEGTVEITLSPEELGKVKLVIVAGERPSVSVIADRMETHDLLRRHGDLLARELRESGIAGADISFSSSGDGAGGNMTSARKKSIPASFSSNSSESVSVKGPNRHHSMSGGIDIRI